MDAPSLETLKARLDVALGSLGCWLVTLHIAGGCNWMSIVVLCNPGHSMIQKLSATSPEMHGMFGEKGVKLLQNFSQRPGP